MPRPRLRRRIFNQPEITYFKPAGVPIAQLEQTILSFDEIEALRLKDYEGMDQSEAAKKMNVSQPTFHRLIVSARKKTADALVNGKSIRIQGGVFKMARPGLGRRAGGPPTKCICPVCKARVPKKRGIPCAQMKCPDCGAMMTRG
ncbi:DUF134 domain-containing protein [Candidatus Woesearchaeota archaeon]|nr:DUF134 domain-containing protein [Candidatus Woesearchaeota archaeon]